LPYHLDKKYYHISPQNCQQSSRKPEDDKNKPNKDDDDDKDKISSLLAKAFLWMLTAYMVIAIISLMFPSSGQPEVFNNVICDKHYNQDGI
jgi:spastic paraplegia protein 7